MSEPNTNRNKLDQRVTNLESLFTHLEQTVSDLDGVVVDGHKKIVELSDKVDNLEKKIESQKHDFPDNLKCIFQVFSQFLPKYNDIFSKI